MFQLKFTRRRVDPPGFGDHGLGLAVAGAALPLLDTEFAELDPVDVRVYQDRVEDAAGQPYDAVCCAVMFHVPHQTAADVQMRPEYMYVTCAMDLAILDRLHWSERALYVEQELRLHFEEALRQKREVFGA